MKQKLGSLYGTKLAFLAGFVTCFVGCATVTFGYKFYNLRAYSYDGDLLGPTPQDNLALKQCEPDEKDKFKCVVMIKNEFDQLRTDYLDIKQKLIICQKPRLRD